MLAMKMLAVVLAAVSLASLATVLGGCGKTDSKGSGSSASLPSASAMANDVYMQQPRGSNDRDRGTRK
jgi:ABC-type oligopeptide transport system substrate-binding subunit